jgi:hypothetical protein
LRMCNFVVVDYQVALISAVMAEHS